MQPWPTQMTLLSSSVRINPATRAQTAVTRGIFSLGQLNEVSGVWSAITTVTAPTALKNSSKLFMYKLVASGLNVES